MIKYFVSQQANFIMTDDINLISFIKRDEDDKEESYSVLRKIKDNKLLNSNNGKLHVASAIARVEMARLRGNTMNDIKEDSDFYRIYGLLYRSKDSDNYIIESSIAANIGEASEIFKTRIKELEIDESDISVFQIGMILKNDDNEKFNKCIFNISIEEKESPNLLIKKGLDSFREFNRKLYICELIMSYAE